MAWRAEARDFAHFGERLCGGHAYVPPCAEGHQLRLAQQVFPVQQGAYEIEHTQRLRDTARGHATACGCALVSYIFMGISVHS